MVNGKTSARLCFSCPLFLKMVVCGHRLATLSLSTFSVWEVGGGGGWRADFLVPYRVQLCAGQSKQFTRCLFPFLPSVVLQSITIDDNSLKSHSAHPKSGGSALF